MTSPTQPMEGWLEHPAFGKKTLYSPSLAAALRKCLTLIERGSRGVEMNKSIVLRVLCAAVVLATLAFAPESGLAQRGGHGGGGFHGGGWGGGHYGGYHG